VIESGTTENHLIKWVEIVIYLLAEVLRQMPEDPNEKKIITM
jgi:hypothetical protein